MKIEKLEVVKNVKYCEEADLETTTYTFTDGSEKFKISVIADNFGLPNFVLNVKDNYTEQEISNVEIRRVKAEAELYHDLMTAVHKRLLKYEPDFKLNPDILDE